MDLVKLKVLVVDDSAMARDAIAGGLKALGAVRIDKVENGKEALLKIKRAINDSMPYDLMTLAWELPEMSGLELLRIIRADSVMKSLLVLMVSSKADPEELKLLAPLQPSGYIVKPFTSELLEKRIKRLLAKTDGR